MSVFIQYPRKITHVVQVKHLALFHTKHRIIIEYKNHELRICLSVINLVTDYLMM